MKRAALFSIVVCWSTFTFAQSLTLYGMGDWGIPTPDREQVGAAMAKQAATDKPAAVLLLGDNYYVPLTGVDDPQIQTFFEKTYPVDALPMSFYAVLGNHDYNYNNKTVEFAYAARGNTRFKLPTNYYRLDFPQNDSEHSPLVTILMLDSNQQAFTAADWQTELTWIDSELSKPHAPWLICCGHHDIFGNGSHGDNGVLMTAWGELFKKHHVDFYLCGHEHAMEHIERPDWPVSFLIAGGGGAGRKGMLRDNRGPFSKSSFGFATLHFDNDKASVQLLNEKNEVLHAFERTHDGKIKVTVNTPSDPATSNPLKVIQGIGE